MFTKPLSCVRVTARQFEGRSAGKSKTITLYGTTVAELIARLVEMVAPNASNAVGCSVGEVLDGSPQTGRVAHRRKRSTRPGRAD